jgi:hypothetical protein
VPSRLTSDAELRRRDGPSGCAGVTRWRDRRSRRPGPERTGPVPSAGPAAVHEAAHAVVAWAVGGSFDIADVVLSSEHPGRWLDLHQHLPASVRVQVMLAGPLSATFHRPAEGEALGCSLDAALVADVSEEYAREIGAERAVDAALLAVDRTAALLGQHKAAVWRVAALLESRQLAMAEVAAIVGAAPGESGGPAW